MLAATSKFHGQRGFTLVEVLVVITIIGILMAMLLPAVQAARESARRAQCQNRLKQIGLAMESHVSTYGRYPSNGWGHGWVGIPDRGTDQRQPGGWIYNLLPYLEHGELREMGRGMQPAEQRMELTRLVQSPLSIMTCPTRAAPPFSPSAPKWLFRNAYWVPQIPKNDYAVNGGDWFTDAAIWEGPLTIEQGDAGQYPWADLAQFKGICYTRSEIQPATVEDGLSQTYLIGEKYVSRPNYNAALDEGYNQVMYAGQCLDLTRWVLQPPQRDADSAELADSQRFGSAHPAGCHFVFCDGSVRMISYQVDAEVHRRLGNRKDGLPIGAGQY